MAKRVYRHKEQPIAVQITIAAAILAQNERVLAGDEEQLDRLQRHPELRDYSFSVADAERNVEMSRKSVAELRDRLAALQAQL